MKEKFKLIVSLVIALVAVGALSISAHAATMFSLGAETEISIENGQVTVPIYLETTDYNYIGGYHIFVNYPSESYTYKSFSDSSAVVNSSTEGQLVIVWASGSNVEVTNEKFLLGSVTFSSSVTDAAIVKSQISLRPRQLTYIANVGNTEINSGNGTSEIMDITEAATYITFNIPKSLEGWTNGRIEALYLADENQEKPTQLENVIDNGDYYRVVVKLRLADGDSKQTVKLTLLADTSDADGKITNGVLLNTFESVTVENMNKA